MAGMGVGIYVGIAIKQAMIPEDLYLPAFSITAEEIFANRIYLFDVDFFDINNKTYKVYKEGKVTVGENKEDLYAERRGSDYENDKQEFDEDLNDALFNCGELNIYGDEEINSGSYQEIIVGFLKKINDKYGNLMSFETGKSWNVTTTPNKQSYKHDEFGSGLLLVAAIYYYDEYENNVLTVTYNFFVNNETGKRNWEEKIWVSTYAYEKIIEEPVEVNSTAQDLKGIVSKWYFILRNFALLVLMLILIYTGIRIVIGSTAGEKAKYKERLMDWLVAICLVLIMHYIMVFAVAIVDKITDLVASTTNGNVAYIQLTKKQRENIDSNNKLAAFKKRMGNEILVDGKEHGKHGALRWPTDLAGIFRIQSQMEDEGTSNWVGFSLCYIVLVLFMVFFAFTYAKRVLYMAFLTMIAPLVAMTYPIDKMTDGKAQAFDSWLKEYIFNLMIQPLHLLLYTVLVSSAYELASKSPIYALVAVGFMMPAEKLLRRFFGFEKAKTPGLLGGAAGAALAMSGMQSLLKPKHGGGNNSGKGQNQGKGQEQGKVKFAHKNNVDAMNAIAQGNNSGRAGSNSLPVGATGTNGGEGENLGATHNEGGQNDNGVPYSNQDVEDALSESFDADEIGNENNIDLFENNEPGNLGEDNLPEGLEPETPEVPTSQSNPENQQGTKKKRHIGRAIGVATLGVGKQMAAGVLRGFHPLRLAGKIAVGATAGTAGLLFGVASGDATKALQYATGGVVAGNALASNLSSRRTDLTGIGEDAKRAYYGDEYSEVYKQKMKKEQQKQLESEENIDMLMKMMSVDREGAKKILNGTGNYCLNNTDITDVRDIATIDKLTKGEDKMSPQMAVAAYNYSQKRLGGQDISQMTADKVKRYKERWADEFKEKYPNLDNTQAQEYADQAFKAAIRFNKERSNLTKF